MSRKALPARKRASRLGGPVIASPVGWNAHDPLDGSRGILLAAVWAVVLWLAIVNLAVL